MPTRFIVNVNRIQEIFPSLIKNNLPNIKSYIMKIQLKISFRIAHSKHSHFVDTGPTKNKVEI